MSTSPIYALAGQTALRTHIDSFAGQNSSALFKATCRAFASEQDRVHFRDTSQIKVSVVRARAYQSHTAEQGSIEHKVDSPAVQGIPDGGCRGHLRGVYKNPPESLI